jgi:hypothetical protein
MKDQPWEKERTTNIFRWYQCHTSWRFPPVARPIRDALFYPNNPEKDILPSQIGRSIYEEFSTVVHLKQQCHTHDPVWLDFLRNLRKGTIDDNHLRMLETLIIGRKGEESLNDGMTHL